MERFHLVDDVVGAVGDQDRGVFVAGRGQDGLAVLERPLVGSDAAFAGFDEGIKGSLAVGKLADLIAVEGNPLEDITATQRVRWVMQGGRVLK